MYEPLAQIVGFIVFVITGNSKTRNNIVENKIISDCCEALIGAIYLDSNLKSVEKFIFHQWKEFLRNSKVLHIDPKTKLQEYSLKKFKKLQKFFTLT